jgi:hypothetical protein
VRRFSSGWDSRLASVRALAHLVGLCWCRLDVGGFGMTESKASKTTDGCAVLSLKADSLGRSS